MSSGLEAAGSRIYSDGIRRIFGESHTHYRAHLAPRVFLADLRADAFLVSYPKCGRTWLRFMLGAAFDAHFSLGSTIESQLELEPLGARPGVPRVQVTHEGHPDHCRADELAGWALRYLGKRVVLLVRDPRDVLVSMYFHHSRRQSRFDGTLAEFVMEERGSLRTIVAYYNTWIAKRRWCGAFHLVRYEALRADPRGQLAGVLRFLRVGATANDIERAVAAASFDRMRALEAGARIDNTRLASNRGDVDSFKTRRGKVGGYVDYLDEGQRAIVDGYIRRHLDRSYGY